MDEIFLASFVREIEKKAIGTGYREYRAVKSPEIKSKVPASSRHIIMKHIRNYKLFDGIARELKTHPEKNYYPWKNYSAAAAYEKKLVGDYLKYQAKTTGVSMQGLKKEYKL